MKNLMLHLSLLVLTSSCVLAQTHRQPATENAPSLQKFRIVQFKDGILKVLMDTCGNQILPVVAFKPLQEAPASEFNYGLYRATITRSKELAPSTLCPYIAPSPIEIDLKALLKEWSDSEIGTSASKEIFKNRGSLEILVSPIVVDMDFTYRAN